MMDEYIIGANAYKQPWGMDIWAWYSDIYKGKETRVWAKKPLVLEW